MFGDVAYTKFYVLLFSETHFTALKIVYHPNRFSTIFFLFLFLFNVSIGFFFLFLE